MKQKDAFTLLELSIVLTIIGLIMGGIVIGRSLVRQGELRAAVSEYDTYLKAIKEFQDKYLALPGDTSTAANIWGATVTDNGDGNGTIGTSSTAGVIADTAGTGSIGSTGEWFLAWQHLALAGFISGSYPGTGTTSLAGTNVPLSKSGGGWTVFYYLNSTNGTSLWPDQYGHVLAFAASGANYATPAISGILTPAEASDIDTKLDDGMPGTGKIRAWRHTVLNNCTDETVPTQIGTIYSTAYAGKTCALVFLLGF